MDPFFNGVAIGFAVAAPVGPIGILCIRRTLADGALAGLVCGLGAATADAGYAALAAFALTIATALVSRAAEPLHIGGGLFLIVLGVRTALATMRSTGDASNVARSYVRAFLTTLGLTAVNPATILSFAAIFAGAAFGSQPPTGLGAVRLVAGVFVGSTLWWLTLSTIVGTLRRSVTPRVRRLINVVSAAIFIGFGASALATR